jgi:hypothetical protein
MALSHILNPEDEDQEEDGEPVTLVDIIQEHTQQPFMDEDAILEDVEP